MRHRFLMVLLGIGAVVGFTSGFVSLAHRHHALGYRSGYGPHAEFEDHVADICTRAAERVYRAKGSASQTAAP
ncbi:MAG TPA: hypothetical protein VFQ61_24750 [Polyangiaceae bacterium]|nr:hypothetical protein [Polyangiaceae bacterium]